MTSTIAPTSPATLRTITWTAAGLAAAASLLHWAGGENHTHQWTAEGLLLVVAGTALMALAVALVTVDGADPRARAVELVGAAGAAVLVIVFLGGTIVASSAGGQHGTHGATDAAGIRLVDAAAAAAAAALVVALVWLNRLRAHDVARPDRSRAY